MHAALRSDVLAEDEHLRIDRELVLERTAYRGQHVHAGAFGSGGLAARPAALTPSAHCPPIATRRFRRRSAVNAWRATVASKPAAAPRFARALTHFFSLRFERAPSSADRSRGTSSVRAAAVDRARFPTRSRRHSCRPAYPGPNGRTIAARAIAGAPGRRLREPNSLPSDQLRCDFRLRAFARRILRLRKAARLAAMSPPGV